MSVVAEFTIDQSEFALGAALATATGMQLELDRILPVSNPGVPYLWASGSDFARLETMVSESEYVASIEQVDRAADTALYRVEWAADTETLIQKLARANTTILEGRRDGEAWFFRLRFDDHEDLSDFHDYCARREITYDLQRVYSDLDRASPRAAFDLTHEQYDTLRLAVERGYFQVPRAVTLQAIGKELDISPQAVSERLRRASDRVLRTVLFGPLADVAAPD